MLNAIYRELGFEDFERPLLEFLESKYCYCISVSCTGSGDDELILLLLVDYRKEANESKKNGSKKTPTKDSNGGEVMDDSMNAESDDEGDAGAGNAEEENMEDDVAESEDDAMEN